MADIKKLLGERVQYIRKTKTKLTQENVAVKADISIESYSKIERGKVWPKYNHLRDIAKVLKVKPSEFFNFNSKESLGKEFPTFLSHLEKADPSNVKLALKSAIEILNILENELRKS